MRGRSAKLGRVEGTGEFWTGEDRTRGLLLDGVGSFTFPQDTPFAEADDAFALGEKVIFQGWMHDPPEGLVPDRGTRPRVGSELQGRGIVHVEA